MFGLPKPARAPGASAMFVCVESAHYLLSGLLVQQKVLTGHCVINRFEMKMRAQQMRVEPKNYSNIPPQLLFI